MHLNIDNKHNAYLFAFILKNTNNKKHNHNIYNILYIQNIINIYCNTVYYNYIEIL